MIHASARIAALMAIAALTASCVPSGKAPRGTYSGDGGFSNQSAKQCMRRLKSQKIKFTPLPDRNYGGGCAVKNAVRLLDFGTPTSNLGPMTCSLASEFADWTRDIVRPAVRRHFGSRLAKIETTGTYSCRRVSGSGRLSQHAHANAVDVFAFKLDNGRRISVLRGWNGTRDEQRFLREIQDKACGRFGTVLGPRYNRQHANHFHLDMAPSRIRGASFCR